MIPIGRWTAAVLTATFLLLVLLIAGGRILQAAPAEQGAIDKIAAKAAESEDKAEEQPTTPPAKEGNSQPPSLSSAEKDDVKRWQSGTWQVSIDLDAPSLTPQAVQFAIIDKDPVAAFAAQAKRMQSYSRQQLAKAENEARKEQLRNVDMTVGWDSGFKGVTGDNLWLLTKVPGSFSSHVISSNSRDGKKWVVTKTVQIKGKPVCWCLPVDLKTGEQAKITLSESNVFDLRAAYDEATREPAGAGDKEPSAQGGPPAKQPPSAISALTGALQKALERTTPKLAEGDAEGHELYRQMIGAMRAANSLSYVGHYAIKGKGGFAHDCTYRVWLKKPNYFRVETESASLKKGGILIGDGNQLWIHWPEGRPFVDDKSEDDKKTRLTSYMTQPAPLAAHSIGHEVCYLGVGDEHAGYRSQHVPRIHRLAASVP